eukprot:109324_1
MIVNISISKYKFHDSKLIRVKKYIFIHFDGKWVRIQFIEGTKSIYILKRIFHKLGLSYDDVIAAQLTFYFTNKSGKNVSINSRMTSNTRLYLKIVNGNSGEGGSSGGTGAGGDNKADDDEEELKFKLASTLTQWNSKNCVGFKVLGSGKHCKCVTDLDDETIDTKHIIISKSGIKYNNLIYKWTIMMQELRNSD